MSLHVVIMMKACTQKQLGADEAGSQASSDADNANGYLKLLVRLWKHYHVPLFVQG